MVAKVETQKQMIERWLRTEERVERDIKECKKTARKMIGVLDNGCNSKGNKSNAILAVLFRKR